MTIQVKTPLGVPTPATPTQIATLQTDLAITPNATSTSDVQALIAANASLGAMAPAVQVLIDLAVAASATSIIQQTQTLIQDLDLNDIANTGTPLDPSHVGPVVDAGTTYTQATFNAFVSQKAGAGGTPSPTAPVKNAAPTLAFTGGTGDVGENATYTQGTYTGGTVTSRDVQVVINGVVTSTITSISNGAAIPIPTAAGQGARQFGIVELANWTGGAAVTNPSAVATINAPGVPTVSVAPAIVPATATELTALVPTQGTYTVNGTTVANSTLTFTYRWTADWTLTGALSAATSANFTTNWLGTTGSYTVIFSDGSTKTTTLTNGSAAFTWTGAVTATSAVKVQLATTATLQLNSNNISHVMRYYETPTGSGGAGTEQQASNTVTPTDSTAGTWAIEAGHRWAVSIPASGPRSWADYQSRRAAYPVTSPRVSQNAEALVAAIPTSYSTTLAAGSTAAQINTALTNFSIVALSQGTYNIGTMITVPANKWLIGLGTGAFLDCSTNTSHGVRLVGGASGGLGGKAVNLTIYNSANLGLWPATGAFAYKVSVQRAARTAAWSGWSTDANQYDMVFVSSEVLNTRGGNEGDGMNAGKFGGGNVTYVDCHGFENDDDNFDVWQAAYSIFHHYCSATRAGKNTVPGAVVGNGTGFKHGVGSVAHFYNQCVATDNLGYGYNYNSQTVPVTLRLCTASGNNNGTYGFTGAVPDSHYVIVNV